MKFDETELRKAIAVLKPDDELYEVRICGKSKESYSGYFKGADVLVKELNRFPENGNVYFTVNHIADGCSARDQFNSLIKAKATTSDIDIDGIEWLFVDFDPKRPTGISSTDEEFNLSKDLAEKVFGFLTEFGFEKPLVADSGNGVHLLYKIALSNNKENIELLKKSLETLSMLFSTDKVDVDRKNFNPSRICKLYGSWAVKGTNTEERPHRLSRIRSTGELKTTDKKYLEKLCELLPKEEKPQQYNNYHPQDFDLDEWLNKYNIGYAKELKDSYTKYILDECPFDSNHKGKDACIFKSSSGAIGFYCFHNSCSGKTWKDVRLKYEPNAYERKNTEWHKESYKPNREVHIEEVENRPVFYTAEEIMRLPKVDESFIKTGITILDKRLRGLKKGFVSLVSGLRGSSKSTLLSQWALMAVDNGFNVGMFSGELTEKNFMRWMYLQAAGKGYTEQGMYEGFYNVPYKIQTTISKWLGNKFFLYNNYYGNNFKAVLKQFEKMITEKKLDLLILDNLMAFDITDLSDDKWDAQKLFIQELQKMAKEMNIHIIFVAHPRKAMGFLRLDDISGSADLSNLADNAFIVHRVNNDFRRLTGQMFGWKADNEIYTCTNCIEVAKDRDGGTQDLFIPLWYEAESKRLKNDKTESIILGWQESFHETKLPFEEDQ